MRRIVGIDFLTTIEELVEPARTAVIVIDMQNESVSKQGGHARAGTDISGVAAIVPRIQRLLKATKYIGVLVIYSEYITRDKLGVTLTTGPNLYHHGHASFVPDVVEGTWEAQTIDELAPDAGDIVLSKTRSSAMYHTLLDDVLGMRGIRSLILTGVATDECVLDTAVDTVQHGYYVVIIRDCVASFDMKRHEQALALMETRLPVVNLDEVLGTWQGKL